MSDKAEMINPGHEDELIITKIPAVAVSYSQITSPPQADTDERVIEMWLSRRPKTTNRAYNFEIKRAIEFINKPVRAITLGDLQKYFDNLTELSSASQARSINAFKSLFSFAMRIGYVKFNPCAAIPVPKIKNSLAERIMTEEQVHKILALENNDRNKIMLRLLYAAGIRVSELCGLKWRDVQERSNAGQVTVFGKGGKTRVILLSSATWKELMTLKEKNDSSGQDDPMFRSKKEVILILLWSGE